MSITSLCVSVSAISFGRPQYKERFSTSFVLVFDGLKDADGGGDRGGAVRAIAEFGQQFPGFEGGHGGFAGSAVAGGGRR